MRIAGGPSQQILRLITTLSAFNHNPTLTARASEAAGSIHSHTRGFSRIVLHLATWS